MGLACLRNPWVRFDLLIVILATVEQVAALTSAPTSEDDATGGVLGMNQMLKLARLAKTLRGLRLIAQFRTLWFIVRGLISTAGALLSVTVLLFLNLYVFALLGLEFTGMFI